MKENFGLDVESLSSKKSGNVFKQSRTVGEYCAR
jgi:hypothetical protein